MFTLLAVCLCVRGTGQPEGYITADLPTCEHCSEDSHLRPRHGMCHHRANGRHRQWRGVAWRGVAWRGVAWREVARRGVAWRACVRAAVPCVRTVYARAVCACAHAVRERAVYTTRAAHTHIP